MRVTKNQRMNRTKEEEEKKNLHKTRPLTFPTLSVPYNNMANVSLYEMFPKFVIQKNLNEKKNR